MQHCSIPALDAIRLPHRAAFCSAYNFYATTMHERAHSTMHKKRLDRSDGFGKRWGDEAYAMEELTAKIASAILASETGVPMASGKAYLDNHPLGLSATPDPRALPEPMAIVTAAKGAANIATYVLGLARQMTAQEEHKEWVADYDRRQ